MECSLCCEAFTEEGAHVPRNLDCGHTFCTLCIERLETHAPLRQGPRCPDCRAVIRFNRRTVPNLPKNYKLLELIREQRAAAAAQQNHHHQRQRHPHHHNSHHHHLHAQQQSSQQKTQRMTPPSSSHSCASTAMTSCSTAVGLPVVPASRPRHGMMYATATPPPPPAMGSYLSPSLITARLEEWMPLRPVPSLPDGRPTMRMGSFSEDVRPTTTTTTTRIAQSASEETVSRNRTPPPSVLPPVRSSPEALPDVPEAVESGRAVTGPNGRLVCKFFQEGTCRYGHNCWFHHPVLNENKSMCRHWMKGQCRMGLMCNFRHGKPPGTSQRLPTRQRQSHQQHQQQQQSRHQNQCPPPLARDPSAPGPSGEGPVQPVRPVRPSVVIFVTSCGSTVHHPAPPARQERTWGNLPTQAGAAGRSFSPESERFFDDFSSSSFHQQ